MLNIYKDYELTRSGIDLIHQILTKNQRSHNGKLWISSLLFHVLTESSNNYHYNTCIIDGIQYIELASVPEEIRNELGLFRIKTRERLVDNEPSLTLTVYNTRIKDRYAKSDVKAALRSEKRYRHEFIDHYYDPNTIKIKARTLSILRFISKGEKTKEYFEAVYNVLVSWKVPCEFPLDNFKLFYEKYEWYMRTGIVPALLNNNYNPNF